MAEPPFGRLLKVKTVSRLLDMHHSEVMRLIKNGDIKATRIGKKAIRIFENSLMDYISRKKEESIL